MPIRINLLAEAQALEESRRRDPVKRSLIGSGFVIAMVLFWSGILQLKIIASKAELKDYEVKWQGMEEGYTVAANSQRDLIETEKKLASLESLRTNRFLWGSILNAFQRSMNGMEKVRVVRIKADQAYTKEGGAPAQTNGVQVIPAKPATAIERISVSVEALDSSTPPGNQVNRFKTAILSVPYFQDHLQKTNGVLLNSLSPPQTEEGSGDTYVRFSLQCLFPEKMRQ